MRGLFLLVVVVLAVSVSKSNGQTPCSNGDTNCDPRTGILYEPILCTTASTCFCPEEGSPICGMCPNDRGSTFQSENVCYCNNVDTNPDGFECNPPNIGGPTDEAPSPTPSESPSAAPSLSPTPNPDPGEGSNDGRTLSTAAIVGISIAAALVLLVACILLIWCLHRRRRRDSRHRNEENAIQGPQPSATGHSVQYQVPLPPPVPPHVPGSPVTTDMPEVPASRTWGQGTVASDALTAIPYEVPQPLFTSDVFSEMDDSLSYDVEKLSQRSSSSHPSSGTGLRSHGSAHANTVGSPRQGSLSTASSSAIPVDDVLQPGHYK